MNSLEPMIVVQTIFPLSHVYDGYVTHEVPCYAVHARAILVESSEQKEGRFLIVHTLDRGLVGKPPAYSMKIVVYEQMNGVTPLGPAPGELLGVVRVTRAPFAYYVFLLRAPRVRETPTVLGAEPGVPDAPTSTEEAHQPVGLKAAPNSPEPPAPLGLTAGPEAPDDDLLW